MQRAVRMRLRRPPSPPPDLSRPAATRDPVVRVTTPRKEDDIRTGRIIAGTLGTLQAAASATAGAQATRDRVPGSAAAAASGGLSVALDEYAIRPLAASVKAGRVKISVKNRGKQVHEMLVVKANGSLPLKGKGVDEAKLERKHRVIGEIADVAPGQSGAKTFAPRTGTYLLFCTLPGHYTAGMEARLVVHR